MTPQLPPEIWNCIFKIELEQFKKELEVLLKPPQPIQLMFYGYEIRYNSRVRKIVDRWDVGYKSQGPKGFGKRKNRKTWHPTYLPLGLARVVRETIQ